MYAVLCSLFKSFFIHMMLCFGNVNVLSYIIGELKYSTAMQESTLFKETFPISLIGCAKQCLTRSSTCRSFNYFRSMNLCQLSFSDNLTFVKEDIDSLYSPIKGWTKGLVGGCGTVRCGERYFCDETKNVTCQLSECGPIPQYQNMKTSHFDRSISSWVRYICALSFFASGDDLTSICNVNGTWSKRSGNCIAESCGDPPTVENSIVDTGSNAAGSTRNYTCKPGYELIGSATLTCQPDGKWSNSEIVCYERCPLSKGFSYVKNIDICYKIHQTTQPMSNNEAKDVCLQMEKSTLLTIKTKVIQDYYTSIVKEDKFYHIDGNFDDDSGQWKDKSGNNLTYLNWRSIQRLSTGCIILQHKSWIQYPCEKRFNMLVDLICEYANCPKVLSYTYYPGLNMCYKINYQKVNLTEARRICLRNGSSLLKIDNPLKQSYVRHTMRGGWNLQTIFLPKQNTDKIYTNILLSDIGYVVGKTTSIKLRVKACSDFHIGLLSKNDASATEMYEILIGGWGNTKSVIRKNKQQFPFLAEIENPTTGLQCTALREVKVYWGSGNITVFLRGKYLLGYNDPFPMKVNYIGVSGGLLANVELRVNIGERFWIDGTYKNNKWQYDTMEEMTYTDWDKNQPNENNDKDVGVVINKNAWISEAFWWDEDSQNQHPFICEYR